MPNAIKITIFEISLYKILLFYFDIMANFIF